MKLPYLPIKQEQTTEISEIFSSLQGEGPYLGKRQIFVRFGRCNMHCGYCDETDKMKPGGFQVRTMSAVMRDVIEMEKKEGPHHSVSLTGGEPLFYSRFLESFIPELKSKGMGVYLETNGTLPDLLRRHVRSIDVIAMDMKPPSSTGDREYWDEHKEFLEVARDTEVFVKVVVTPKVTVADIERAVSIVKGVNPTIPFIFQPLSEMTGISTAALQLIEKQLMPIAAADLKDVRVIPQMHKIWGVR